MAIFPACQGPGNVLCGFFKLPFYSKFFLFQSDQESTTAAAQLACKKKLIEEKPLFLKINLS